MKDELISEGSMEDAYARILMYSGPDWDPRINLTDEQVDYIIKKISYLTEPVDKEEWPSGLACLGVESYLVVIPQLCAIYVSHKGIVKLATEPYETYSIDIGNSLHSYLKELLAPALQKHMDDCNKAMEKYNEKMLGIPDKEKV